MFCKLIGEQRPIFILKNGLQLERPGGGVDLIVQRQQIPGSQLGLLVAIKKASPGTPSPFAQLLLDLRQKKFLGYRKDYGNWL